MKAELLRHDEGVRIHQVKFAIDAALSAGLENDPSAYLLNRFRGRLSTDPLRVDPTITAQSLAGECGNICSPLQRALRNGGLHTRFVHSEAVRGVANALHYYLTTEDNIAIDPTIGQVVIGHNHIFVGTFSKLKDVVSRAASEGRLLNRERFPDTDRYFQLMWGWQPRIVSSFG